MPYDLPDDVYAIDTGDKSLLFYVYADPNGDYRLSYLESPNYLATGDFTVKKIKKARDPWEADEKETITVSAKNKQVAAITWTGSRGVEVRVYYVQDVKVQGEYRPILEVCKTGDEDWKIGALSYNNSNLYEVRPGTSISASVHKYGNAYNLRVFAAEAKQVNKKGVPQISVFKFNHDESNTNDKWQGDPITSTITEY